MRIKKLILLLLISFPSAGQTSIPVDEGSSIVFQIRNFGLLVEGTFTGIRGNIIFDPANVDKCAFDVSIDAGSIDTGIALRNQHLRKEKYLDTETYPAIRFVSEKLSFDQLSNKWIVSGHLTIKKTTRKISFPFTVMQKQESHIFKGGFSINRHDFRIGESSFSMGDEVAIKLQVMTGPVKF